MRPDRRHRGVETRHRVGGNSRQHAVEIDQAVDCEHADAAAIGQNGEPLALMNDGYIQHMRVGGCAGLGAETLARADAEVLGLVGSGGMARTYLEAIHLARPWSSGSSRSGFSRMPSSRWQAPWYATSIAPVAGAEMSVS